MRYETYDQAKAVIDEIIERDGLVSDQIYSWLVVDEDYFDGVRFTREELENEVASAQRIQERANKLRSVIVSRRNDLTPEQVDDIVRTLALNGFDRV